MINVLIRTTDPGRSRSRRLRPSETSSCASNNIVTISLDSAAMLTRPPPGRAASSTSTTCTATPSWCCSPGATPPPHRTTTWTLSVVQIFLEPLQIFFRAVLGGVGGCGGPARGARDGVHGGLHPLRPVRGQRRGLGLVSVPPQRLDRVNTGPCRALGVANSTFSFSMELPDTGR